jgi:hypothetical protein
MYSLFNHSCQVPCIVSVDNIEKELRCFLAFGGFEKGQEAFNSYLLALALGFFEQSSEAGNAWRCVGWTMQVQEVPVMTVETRVIMLE